VGFLVHKKHSEDLKNSLTNIFKYKENIKKTLSWFIDVKKLLVSERLLAWRPTIHVI